MMGITAIGVDDEENVVANPTDRLHSDLPILATIVLRRAFSNIRFKRSPVNSGPDELTCVSDSDWRHPSLRLERP